MSKEIKRSSWANCQEEKDFWTKSPDKGIKTHRVKRENAKHTIELEARNSGVSDLTIINTHPQGQ